MKIRNLLTAIACASLMACTSMQLYTGPYAELADVLEPGDHVLVRDSSGKVTDFEVTRVTATELEGTLTGRKAAVVIPIANIERIDIERIDRARTALAVVAGASVVVLTVVAAEAAAASAILGATP